MRSLAEQIGHEILDEACERYVAQWHPTALHPETGPLDEIPLRELEGSLEEVVEVASVLGALRVPRSLAMPSSDWVPIAREALRQHQGNSDSRLFTGKGAEKRQQSLYRDVQARQAAMRILERDVEALV